MAKIVILASGSGSNAEALIRFSQSSDAYSVTAVISDQPEAFVLQRAKNLKIPSYLVAQEKAETKFQYNLKLLETVKSLNPDWIVLAGYMKLLSAEFLKTFFDSRLGQNRIINIHPSLLPLFPGKESYEKAYNSAESEFGCTIHFVDEGMDTGKIIYQTRLQKIADESFQDFKDRGLALENKTYPVILEKLIKEYRS